MTDTMYIVYRHVFWIPMIPHLEPALDALCLRSDVISSIKNLSLGLEVELHRALG